MNKYIDFLKYKNEKREGDLTSFHYKRQMTINLAHYCLSNVRSVSSVNMESKLFFFASLMLALILSDVDALRKNNKEEQVTCGSKKCGVGAQCILGNVLPVCVCLPGYYGDPLTQCTRRGCIINADCRQDEFCANMHCAKACEKACATNAVCETINHSPLCTCPPGYTGDPFTSCKSLLPVD